jgi:hypothetical protein
MFRSSGRACANHPDTAHAASCTKCGLEFCDACLPFLVNSNPWCHPCAHALQDSLRGNWVLAVLALVVGYALFALVMASQLWFERVNPYSIGLAIAPPLVAYRLAFPPTTGARPVIEARTTTR